MTDGPENPSPGHNENEGHLCHRAVYIISVAAELTGVHPQTLRVYERKGLLSPARTGGMSRRYSEADLEQIRRVQTLTNEGLTLTGVARVLELEAKIERLKRRVAQLSQSTTPSTALVPVTTTTVVVHTK